MTKKMLKIKPTNEDMNVVLEVTPEVWKKYNRWAQINAELVDYILENNINNPKVTKLKMEKVLCECVLRTAGFDNKHYFRTSWVIV